MKENRILKKSPKFANVAFFGPVPGVEVFRKCFRNQRLELLFRNSGPPYRGGEFQGNLKNLKNDKNIAVTEK